MEKQYTFTTPLTKISQNYLILLVGIFFIIGSCKKEYKNSLAPSSINIEKVKNWYLSQKSEVKDSGFVNSLIPRWDSYSQTEQDGIIIFEVPCQNPNKLMNVFGNLDLDDGKKEAELARTTIKLLLFIDANDNKCAGFMLTNGNTTNANQLHYRKLQDFSGSVMYYSLGSKFTNGWLYNNGKVVQIISITKNETNNAGNFLQLNPLDEAKGSRNNGKTMSIGSNCTTNPNFVYYQECITAGPILQSNLPTGTGSNKLSFAIATTGSTTCTWHSRVEWVTVCSGGGDGGYTPLATLPFSVETDNANLTKIDISLLDRIRYPTLAKIIDGLYMKVKNDPKLMAALIKFTHLSKEKILSNLKSGFGPKIIVKELSNIADHYNSTTNTIEIGSHLLTSNNFLYKDYATALEFYIAVSILHEFIHFGENYTQIFLPYENALNDAGFQFENEMYGGRVWFNYATGSITYEKI